MATNNLTADRLRAVLHYCPESGEFTWKVRTSIRIVAGKKAGAKNKRGYIAIGVDGKRYAAHRLAWLWVHGVEPDGQIDHINRIRTDNRLANLRTVSNSENQHNAGLRKNNNSGVHGVSFSKASGKWLAKICVNRRQKYLGEFATLEAATAARKKAELALQPCRNQNLQVI